MIIQGNNPYTSASFSFSHRVKRQVWNWTWLLFFRPSPRPLHTWRTFLLRLFGAKLGTGVHVYPAAKVWAPWNLEMQDYASIADNVTVYNMDVVRIGKYSVVSQGAHLCGGSHDYNSDNFQLYAKPIVLGSNVWVCAEAFISPGVRINDGVVIGARSLVTRDISDSWTVHAGHPAKFISQRERRQS